MDLPWPKSWVLICPASKAWAGLPLRTQCCQQLWIRHLQWHRAFGIAPPGRSWWYWPSTCLFRHSYRETTTGAHHGFGKPEECQELFLSRLIVPKESSTNSWVLIIRASGFFHASQMDHECGALSRLGTIWETHRWQISITITYDAWPEVLAQTSTFLNACQETCQHCEILHA